MNVEYIGYDSLLGANADPKYRDELNECFLRMTIRTQDKKAADAYGRLSTITDPKGRETAFSYDQLGRQLTRTLPLGRTESQAYNSLGQMHTKTDFKGQIMEMVYDSLGRAQDKNLYPDNAALLAQTPAETVSMTYDTLGRQDTVADTRGITDYDYDVNGRLTQVASPEGTINYEYDQVTGRKTRTYSANSDIQYDLELPEKTLSMRSAIQNFQRDLISKLLRKNKGNWAATARNLKMNRSNLHHLAVKLGLK